jgi:NitT/TauT family transport system substrate-binding protein
MVVDTGIIPKAPLVKKALPKCNLCCITGNDMKDSIGVFYEKIFALDKQSIGAMPDDGFYYVAK